MTRDPFEALRLPAEPARPAPTFVARLRRQLVAELGARDPTELPEVELDSPRDAVPHHVPTPNAAATTDRSTSMITPYICVAGATEAIEWYSTVFAAHLLVRYDGDDGRVGHAELALGDARLFLSDEHPEIGVIGPRTLGGTPVTLHLDVADVDAVYASAVRSGARSEREPADQAYGARSATIVDPFGHRWMVQTPTGAALTIDELNEQVDGYTITAGPDAEPAAVAPVAVAPAPVELGYFTVAAPDTVVAARFYGALFGWATEPGNVGVEYAHVHNTTMPLGIVPGEPGTAPTLYFRVPSVAEYAAKVRELGGEVVDQSTWDSGPGAECRDNQGCTFHLWEAAPGY